MQILPFYDFHDFDAGIDHIRGRPDRYVLKPCGEAANTKRWLFVGDEEDGSDVVRMLEAHKRASGPRIERGSRSSFAAASAAAALDAPPSKHRRLCQLSTDS